jgi:hypothetical protein
MALCLVKHGDNFTLYLFCVSGSIVHRTVRRTESSLNSSGTFFLKFLFFFSSLRVKQYPFMTGNFTLIFTLDSQGHTFGSMKSSTFSLNQGFILEYVYFNISHFTCNLMLCDFCAESVRTCLVDVWNVTNVCCPMPGRCTSSLEFCLPTPTSHCWG